MTEVIIPPTADVLVEPTDETEPQRPVVPATSQNLMKQSKMLSILMQIYNWQPCGTSIRITLPIVTQYNFPLFSLKVTPFWLPLKFFGSLSDNEFSIGAGGGSGRINAWLAMKPWAWLADARYAASFGTPTPSGVNFVEKDDMPDIAWFALNHSAWRGSINIAVRVVSNVTTQGKLAVSRLYEVSQNMVSYNANTARTLVDHNFSSQSLRFKNSSMIFDLSRASDLVVQCPYISKRPVIRTADYFSQMNIRGGTDCASWLNFDILNALDTSAGSNQLILDFWIQAGPDFEFINPLPPRKFMIDGVSNMAGAPEQTMYWSNSPQPVPYIFGSSGSNITFTRLNLFSPYSSYSVADTASVRDMYRKNVRLLPSHVDRPFVLTTTTKAPPSSTTVKQQPTVAKV